MKDILLPPYMDIVKGLEIFVVENAKQLEHTSPP